MGKLLIGENGPGMQRADLTIWQAVRPMYEEATARR
jgi:hypothetical protein